MTKEELATIMELLIEAKTAADKEEGRVTEKVTFYVNDGYSDEFTIIEHDVTPPTDKKKLH